MIGVSPRRRPLLYRRCLFKDIMKVLILACGFLMIATSAATTGIRGVPVCFSNAVGVANPSVIPDEQMTASSNTSSRYKPAYGRLNFTKGDGWCSSTRRRNDEWLQVDLGQIVKVCGVATQGVSGLWVTAFKLSSSQDGNNWTVYKDDNGNDTEFRRYGESNGVDRHELRPVYARYIRFNPTQRHIRSCLRVEVYGNVLTDCGVKWTKRSKRIVGGQHAAPGEWRWHVLLGKWTGYGGCSGTLLTPDWVITSRDCVGNGRPKTVTLGQHTRSQSSGKEQKRSVSKSIILRQHWHLALLKLTNPATINDHVGTICLPESSKKLPVGTVLWGTGWGITENMVYSDVLKELEVVIVRPRDRDSITFLTTATKQGHGTCFDDWGGPVVAERNGRWYLEGVHSFLAWDDEYDDDYSFECGRTGTMDGLADVRYALQGIKDIIGNN